MAPVEMVHFPAEKAPIPQKPLQKARKKARTFGKNVRQ